MLTADSVIELERNIIIRDDDLVLFNKITGDVIDLNHTGYLLLKIADGKHSLKDLSEALANAFSLDYTTALIDTIEFFNSISSYNCFINKCTHESTENAFSGRLGYNS
ncbi:PqqD family protein [Pontibacter sp. 172403-2]|uniref:PqqD family protein n=1 Tax=Pontibacter rufus TaxID=2791028 RepID=UPI0018AF5698|nr:PqqD family protein [Pontibacter sp. 172403-2]MBF9255620.1 PqqD family protein [Pontibacter sp. 172403-2]